MTVLTRVVPEYGVRQIYNGTGGTLSQGTFVKLKASPTYKNEIEAAATATDAVLGVLMFDVATATYGDCQVYGVAQVLASTTIAVGARVMPTTGAKSLTGTSGNSNVGVAVTAGTTDALHEVELTGPGAGAIP
jgi:hypothetical protein